MNFRAETYRLRALISERLARDATDKAIKLAWTDIGIEWHALANIAGRYGSDEREGEDIQAKAS
jgi:hypothetical protein